MTNLSPQMDAQASNKDIVGLDVLPKGTITVKLDGWTTRETISRQVFRPLTYSQMQNLQMDLVMKGTSSFIWHHWNVMEKWSDWLTFHFIKLSPKYTNSYAI